MPLKLPSIIDTLVEIAERYSGRSVSSADKVGRDLGIDREDAIEFYEEVERLFRVDLRRVTESTILRPKIFFWRRKSKVMGLDPTILTIATYISHHAP